ncbi:MAG: hypothetical protein ABIR65_06950 [Pseudolysinimonas sp.]
MADFTDADFNAENFADGLRKLSQISAGGRMMADVRPADFELQTSEKISFMAGYVTNLIARVERLETERS